MNTQYNNVMLPNYAQPNKLTTKFSNLGSPSNYPGIYCYAAASSIYLAPRALKVATHSSFNHSFSL